MALKTLGIIAGLGPMAGAHFYERLVHFTPAIGDEDHIPTILLSDPAIPSRILHLTGQGPSPVPRLVAVAERLIRAGADFLVMPSTTTSYYYEEIQSQTEVPLVSLVRAVGETLNDRGIRTVGILATTPTRTHHIYEASFRERHMQWIYPDDASQRRVMDLIARVKGMGPASDLRGLGWALDEVVRGDWADTADAVLLGCTELPVIWDRWDPSQRSRTRVVFSATDILAETTVSLMVGRVTRSL